MDKVLILPTVHTDCQHPKLCYKNISWLSQVVRVILLRLNICMHQRWKCINTKPPKQSDVTACTTEGLLIKHNWIRTASSAIFPLIIQKYNVALIDLMKVSTLDWPGAFDLYGCCGIKRKWAWVHGYSALIVTSNQKLNRVHCTTRQSCKLWVQGSSITLMHKQPCVIASPAKSISSTLGYQVSTKSSPAPRTTHFCYQNTHTDTHLKLLTAGTI